jgi:hypothetical protein
MQKIAETLAQDRCAETRAAGRWPASSECIAEGTVAGCPCETVLISSREFPHGALTIVLQIYLHVGHAVAFVHWHILQVSHSSGQQLKQAICIKVRSQWELLS